MFHFACAHVIPQLYYVSICVCSLPNSLAIVGAILIQSLVHACLHPKLRCPHNYVENNETGYNRVVALNISTCVQLQQGVTMYRVCVHVLVWYIYTVLVCVLTTIYEVAVMVVPRHLAVIFTALSSSSPSSFICNNTKLHDCT